MYCLLEGVQKHSSCLHCDEEMGNRKLKGSECRREVWVEI
jgi:hypothetical protein